MSGANLQGTWSRQLSDGSNGSLRAYFDQARREDDFVYHERTRTASVEFDHVPVTPAAHKVIWGAGYRRSRSQTDPTLFFHFEPATRDLNWTHVFVQDEIRISDPLRVTLGLKLESNSYTGVERLPTLRAAYRLADNSSVWGALSRAVRAPARFDRDLFIPGRPPYVINGGPNFVSEVANVAEVGYRAQPSASFSYSLTAFHHEYDKLRAGSAAPTTVDNLAWGTTNGIEAWGTWRVSSVWQLSGGLLTLDKSLHAAANAGAGSVANLGNDPKTQWSLRSTADLGRQVTLDVAVRHVAALPEPAVPAYTATDLRLAWQASPLMELALIVQNLFDPGHAEFQAPAAASEIPRSVFLSLRWWLP
jgi:iron complex outermembrane receptor protein